MKYKIEQLINRSYEAIRGRGLITDKTTCHDFFKKIAEEYFEFQFEYSGFEDNKIQMVEECIDFITAGLMFLHHLGYNFIEEFEKCVEKNEKRAKNQFK